MKLKTLVRGMSPDELQTMARLAKTTVDHIRFQLANGHKRPSHALAVRLVMASKRMYPEARKRWLRLDEWFGMDAAA